MAYSYEIISQNANKIRQDRDFLNSLFNDLNNQIDSNVGNERVWSGASATAFKNKWEHFAAESFPKALAAFDKSVKNLEVANDSYHTAEGQ